MTRPERRAPTGGEFTPTPTAEFELAEGSAPPPAVVEAAGRIRNSVPPDAPDAAFRDALELFGDYVIQKGGGGGGDDGATTKGTRRKRIGLYAVFALLASAGTGIGAWQALESRGENNAAAVEAHEVRIEENTRALRGIESTVDKVNADVGEIKSEQRAIADGIDELKRENVEQLKRERDEALQELRRLRGRAR